MADRTPSRPLSRTLALALAGFPVLVWLVATRFYLDRGKYQDDYGYALRNIATGAIDWSQGIFYYAPGFWRPIGTVIIRLLPTFLYNHWWIYQTIAALQHALVATLIVLLARRMGLSLVPALCAALLFAVWPLGHEPVLWSTCITAGTCTAMMLWLAMLYTRWASDRERARIDASSPAPAAWRFPAMVALAFAIPCVYEQAGAGIAALPLAYLAATPAGQRVFTLRRLFAAAVSAGVLASTQVLYIILLRATAPATMRGGASTLITSPTEMLARVSSVVRELRGMYVDRLSDVAVGAFRLGASTLATPLGWAILAALALAGVAFVVAMVRIDGRNAGSRQAFAGHTLRRAMWLLFALAMAASAWAPLLVLRDQIAETRMTYFAATGLALALAVLIDAVLRRLPEGRARRTAIVATGAWVVPAVICGAVVWVGWQEQFRRRHEANLDQSRQLAQLVPQAPPDTLFVPMGDDFAPARTGHLLFDKALTPWSLLGWLATPMVQHAFAREDLFASGYNTWAGSLQVDELSALGLTVRSGPWPNPPGVFPASPTGGSTARWDQVVPFVIDAQGTVRIVSRVIIERADGTDLVVLPPLAQGENIPTERRVARVFGLAQGAAGESAGTVGAGPASLPGASDGLLGLDAGSLAWTFRRTNDASFAQPAPRHDNWSDGTRRSAIWFPSINATNILTTTLPPSATPRRLVLRVYWPTAPLAQFASLPSSGPTLVATLEGEPAPLASHDSSAALRQDLGTPRWTPVVLTIPPTSQPRTLTLTLEPPTGGAAKLDEVHVGVGDNPT